MLEYNYVRQYELVNDQWIPKHSEYTRLSIDDQRKFVLFYRYDTSFESEGAGKYIGPGYITFTLHKIDSDNNVWVYTTKEYATGAELRFYFNARRKVEFTIFGSGHKERGILIPF